MKQAYRIAGLALALALAGYFVLFLRDAFDPVVLARLANAPTMLAIGAAALLYATIIPLTGWAWRVLLVASPRLWPVLELTAILGVTQVAKYLPGNVAQHAGRLGLAVAHGMRWRDYIASVGIETALAIAAGATVGVLCLQMVPARSSPLPDALAGGPLWLLAALPVALFTVPFILRAAVRGASHGRMAVLAGWLNAIPGWPSQLRAACAYTANYLLIGVGFWLVARAVAPGVELGYATVTAAFALSWLVGFLAPGMPAGLGVREGVMVFMLPDEVPGEVLGIVVAMRIATVLGDLLWFALGSAMLVNSTERST